MEGSIIKGLSIGYVSDPGLLKCNCLIYLSKTLLFRGRGAGGVYYLIC